MSHYTDLRVMRSGGGWYVGTMHWNDEDLDFGFWEPGSRDSGYFATEAEAQAMLTLMTTPVVFVVPKED